MSLSLLGCCFFAAVVRSCLFFFSSGCPLMRSTWLFHPHPQVSTVAVKFLAAIFGYLSAFFRLSSGVLPAIFDLCSNFWRLSSAILRLSPGYLRVLGAIFGYLAAISRLSSSFGGYLPAISRLSSSCLAHFLPIFGYLKFSATISEIFHYYIIYNYLGKLCRHGFKYLAVFGPAGVACHLC